MTYKKRLLNWINRHFQFVKYPLKRNLLIIDDTFPDVHAEYKLSEFQYYNKHIEKTYIITDLFSIKHFNINENFESLYSKYLKTYPKSKIKIKELKLFTNINYKFAYCLFYNNIIRYYKFFEVHKISFGYTLYPGGGFTLENEFIKKKLSEINNSVYCKFVIVNQKTTKRFLLENNICSELKIVYIPGTPLLLSEKEDRKNKLFYKIGKPTFDLAFIASKYTTGGLDKGFDVFCEVCAFFEKKYPFFKFHVIGNFDRNDVPENLKVESLIFYGLQPKEIIEEIMMEIDIVISPNRPNVLGKGFFDGFPLAASALCGFLGVPLMLTDHLNENTFLTNNEDFFLINTNVEEIVTKIEEIIKKPEVLKKISEKSKNKFAEFYSVRNQLESRLELIKRNL